MKREPGGLLLVILLFDVGLYSVHVALVLGFQVDQEEDIVPDFVIFFYVHLEPFFCVTVECLPLQAADVAHVFHVNALDVWLFSELRKCVDNDALHDV